jgi:hypothetical protein
MPTMCFNRIKFQIDDAPQKIYPFILEDGAFKFDNLIPMPLHVYHGNTNTNGKDDKDFGEHTVREWSIKNWGTKWDAMNTRIDTNNPNTIYFETAWNPPYPVIIALANKFKVDFLLEWFDENLNASSELWKLQVGGELDGIMIRDKQHNFKKVEGVAWQEFDDLIRSHGFYRKLSQYLQNSDVFQEI